MEQKRSKTKASDRHETVIPLYGRDEMNLCDLPYGPLTPTGTNTFEITQSVYDKKRRRKVNRKLLVTGSDAFGLPRPVDDQVLLGLTTLTSEAGFESRKVAFSRYHLCRILRWKPDGRAYKRIEESLDRIAGATLKIKDGWWDKGEQLWRSHTFHILDNVELCSKDQYETIRERTSSREQSLCSVVWNEVIWKSFQDGYIRKLDMNLLARIANGRRRDAAVRLFRVLDKHFYRKRIQSWDVRRLCEGTLGSQSKFVSKMSPILEKAAKVLIDVGYLESMSYESGKHGQLKVVFVKADNAGMCQSEELERSGVGRRDVKAENPPRLSAENSWQVDFSDGELLALEQEALELGFGSKFERGIVLDERTRGVALRKSRLVRHQFLKRYVEQEASRRKLRNAG